MLLIFELCSVISAVKKILTNRKQFSKKVRKYDIRDCALFLLQYHILVYFFSKCSFSYQVLVRISVLGCMVAAHFHHDHQFDKFLPNIFYN